jgi:tetratricopeptide (TPR) repeat protein
MTARTGAPSAHELYAEGVRLWTAGDRDRAATKIDAALRIRPDFPEALQMGGFILQERGRLAPAIAFYERALRLREDQPVAWTNLGKCHFRLRRFALAEAAFEQAVARSPADDDAWNALACARRQNGRLEESLRAADEALRLAPNFAEASLNRGNALLKLERLQEALESYEDAERKRPDFADALCGQALALRALDRLTEALACFERAEALGSREATSGKGCLLLSLGDFERGFEGYEARWLAGRSIAEALGSRFPTWSGDRRSGLRLLVMNDHGLGDTIQFYRYLPLLAESGIDVTFLCPAKLHRLLGAADARTHFVKELEPDDRYDAQIALSSLPYAFRTRLETTPARTPYLAAEPGRRSTLARRLSGPGFKVGLCWQGNPDPEADRARALALAAYAPLGAIPGVRLFSLQKGFGCEQIATAPMSVESFGEDYDGGPDAFLDAAAAIMELDLVVTCDTSIAHLAGALGRPVWVALKKDAEWRWLRHRDDSPWYPTMRLFRQPTRGDWAPVCQAMAQALAGILQSRTA